MELRSNVSFALQNLKETSCATLLKKEERSSREPLLKTSLFMYGFCDWWCTIASTVDVF